MVSSEKLIELSEKLPGYFGYRPTMSNGEIHIEEVMFRLSERKEGEKVEYLLSLFFTDNRCVDGVLDARYSDGSVATIKDSDTDFSDIIGHKNKVVSALNKIK